MSSKDTELIIYRSEDGSIKIDTRMEDETVWLSQAQMVELFQTTKQNISLHINNCFKEGELEPAAVVKEYLTTKRGDGSLFDSTLVIISCQRDVYL